MMRLSPMRCSTNRTSQSLLTESKKEATSASKMKVSPSASHWDTLALRFDFSCGAIVTLAVQTSALILSVVQFEAQASLDRGEPGNRRVLAACELGGGGFVFAQGGGGAAGAVLLTFFGWLPRPLPLCPQIAGRR